MNDMGKNSVYESITTGLNEALEDAQSKQPILKRHTKFTRIPVFAVSVTGILPEDLRPWYTTFINVIMEESAWRRPGLLQQNTVHMKTAG